MSIRIGSLFSGTGQLDEAVRTVFGGEVAWHSQYEPPKNGKEDTNQYAARILAHHYPTTPNLGDITKIKWRQALDQHGPIDILTGGFPCQDVSSAGKRAGLTADTRSGLWTHMAHAIHELQPQLVVIENVQGLLSAPADRGLGSDSEALDDPAETAGTLRALGAVLGDLATLGFDAEWCRVAASEVGAPHPRKRVFVLAWPAAVDTGRLGRGNGQGILGRLGTPRRSPEAAAHPSDLGHERGGAARRRRLGPADSDLTASDASCPGLEVRGVEPDRHERQAAERGRGEPATDTDGFEPERRGVAGVLGSAASAEQGEGDQRERAGHPTGDSREAAANPRGCGRPGHRKLQAGRDGVQLGVRHDPDGRDPAATHSPSLGRGEGRAEPAGQQGRPDVAECGGQAAADADGRRQREAVLNLRPGRPDLDWGDYGPAVRRWEHALGRPAPWPTDALGRLSPVFSEWLMGWPDGWVTCVPGLTRGAMLRAIGNGVVPQQAAAAIRLLAERAGIPTAATPATA